MLVQLRADGLRLITQHDHGLAAGQLAAAWRDPPVGPVPWPTVLAVALHDVVWLHEDRRPLLDPDAGRPHDFTSCPPTRKSAFVTRGLERLADLDPGVAEVVAAHHRALATGLPEGPEPALSRVRFFDLLSLRICLTAPGANGAPGWLRSAKTVGPDGLRLPELVWSDERRVILRPFPFAHPVEVHLPYRDLPGGFYDSQDALDAAWRESVPREWVVRLGPSGGRDPAAS